MKKKSFQNLPKSTRHLVLLSQIRLFLTNAIIAIWPLLALTAIYISFGLYNIFRYLPDWLYAISLLAYIAGMLFFLYKAFQILKWPDKRLIIRKIETFSDVSHRPLNNLTDKLSSATNNENQEILWRQNLKYARKQLSKLHLLRPHKTIKQQDPYYIGFIAISLCIVGLFVAGTDRNSRIKQTLTMPISVIGNIIPSYNMPSLFLTAWITPPEYTAEPEYYLYNKTLPSNKISNSLSAPTGSILTLHISDNKYLNPKIYINGKEQTLIMNDTSQYSIDITLLEDTTIVLKYFFLTRLQWNIQIKEDMPPTIILNKDINISEQQELEWSYKVTDDYGIAKLDMFVSPDLSLQKKLSDSLLTKKEKQQFNIAISISKGKAPREIEEIILSDFTSSPFAGYPVVLHMIGEDTKQQIAQSAAVKITLPKRQFTHPVAKELIDIRDKIAWSNEKSVRIQSWEKLTKITYAPEKYKDDTTVFLALVFSRMSLYRTITSKYKNLKKDTKEYETWLNNMQNTRKVLWDTAIHIEDGNFAVAAQDLQDALDNLTEKLENDDLTDKEYKKLVEELQKTMAKYMQALADELNNKMPENQENSDSKLSDTLFEKIANKMDAGSMFEKWQKFSETGSKQDLKDMIDEMKKMMEKMDPEKVKNAKPMDMKEFENAQKLQELVEKQQKLIEETQQEQDKQEEKAKPSPKIELSKEQSEIKEMLNDVNNNMQEKLGNVPKGFSDADKSMGTAIDELKKGNLPISITEEQKALESLQEGMDSELERLATMMENMLSLGGGAGNNQDDGPKDPLGRKKGFDNFDKSDIDIPEELERRKIQEIMRELRNRSNDYERPKFEKDYIKRLLKRF